MPIRSPLQGKDHLTGYFPSLKLERTVAFESTLERDLIYLLEFLPRVLSFEEQPLTLEYGDNGKTRRYTPDFKVVTRSGTLLLECKPLGQVSDVQQQAKFNAAREVRSRWGWRFGVVTEHDLRGGPFLKNVQKISYYARFAPPPHLGRCILKQLRAEPLSPLQLATLFPDHAPGVVQATVMHLAYHQRLVLELQRSPLHPHQIVSAPSQETRELWPCFLPR